MLQFSFAAEYSKSPVHCSEKSMLQPSGQPWGVVNDPNMVVVSSGALVLSVNRSISLKNLDLVIYQ